MIRVMKMKCLQCHQQYLNVSTPPPLLLKKKIKPSPSLEQSKLDFSRILHPTPAGNNSFSFGINWNNFSQSQLSKSLGTCSRGIFSFNGCQININTNKSMQPQQNDNAKRKRHIIYSDSEESQD